jgi:hypothetical protein
LYLLGLDRKTGNRRMQAQVFGLMALWEDPDFGHPIPRVFDPEYQKAYLATGSTSFRAGGESPVIVGQTKRLRLLLLPQQNIPFTSTVRRYGKGTSRIAGSKSAMA